MVFKCKQCGKEFDGQPGEFNRVFCSGKCYHDFRRKQKQFTCPHNEGVVCSLKRCYTCGWNPDVEKRRKEKIRQRRKEILAK